MKKKIYILSGLGADERVFHRMDMDVLSIVHLNWIQPLPSESMGQYASRMMKKIEDPSPILLGLSFGGIMAIEIAKLLNPEKIILLASAKNKYEIPFYYRLIGKLGLHHLIPISFMKKTNFIVHWFFGVRNKEDKGTLKAIFENTNPDFLKWAIHQTLTWKQTTTNSKVFHIHGTDDRILPIRFINYHCKIMHGGHLMTLSHSKELSAIIHKYLYTQ